MPPESAVPPQPPAPQAPQQMPRASFQRSIIGRQLIITLAYVLGSTVISHGGAILAILLGAGEGLAEGAYSLGLVLLNFAFYGQLIWVAVFAIVSLLRARWNDAGQYLLCLFLVPIGCAVTTFVTLPLIDLYDHLL
jgi:hypothetical protein